MGTMDKWYPDNRDSTVCALCMVYFVLNTQLESACVVKVIKLTLSSIVVSKGKHCLKLVDPERRNEESIIYTCHFSTMTLFAYIFRVLQLLGDK